MHTPQCRNRAGGKTKRVNADKAVLLMQFYLASWQAGHIDKRNSDMLHKEIARISKRTGYNEVYVWNQIETEARRQGFAGLTRGRS